MEEQKNETETSNKTALQSENNDRTKVIILSELMTFVKESTGLSIALAYLILILSSMAYLGIYFSAFGIEIIRFITLEDILATPIKNPDIIFVFVVIFVFLYMSDVGNQLNTRRQKKPGEKLSWHMKILTIITWAPKARRNSLKLTGIITFVVLSLYIVVFAYTASSNIKDGEGSKVEIMLADHEMPLSLTLLGTTTHFIFAYDHENNESLVFQLESIKSLKMVAKVNHQGPSNAPMNDENKEKSESVQTPVKDQELNTNNEKQPKTESQ